MAELNTYNVKLTILEPVANKNDVEEEYNLSISQSLSDEDKFDAIILAVAHDEFRLLNLQKYKNEKSVVYDIKGFLCNDLVDFRL